MRFVLFLPGRASRHVRHVLKRNGGDLRGPCAAARLLRDPYSEIKIFPEDIWRRGLRRQATHTV